MPRHTQLEDTEDILAYARKGVPYMLSDIEEEGRGGITKRYRRGLHSTRRTKTRQVPGSEFDESATRRGRSYC